MPFTFGRRLERARVIESEKAFGRLRVLLRQQPVPVNDLLAQASECGRSAYAADMQLAMVVNVLTGLPLPHTYRAGSRPEELIDVAVAAYLVAGEREPHLVGA